MKKIMFSDRFRLTQAVLEGRKKQTRRLVPKEVFTLRWDVKGTFDNPEEIYIENEYGDYVDIRDTRFSRYKAGDVLCVAMSYESIYLKVGLWEYADEYKDKHEKLAGWKNKMFTNTEMPFAKVRIINNRVQRLQDITDEECLLEGIEKEEQKDGGYNYIFFDAKRNLYIRERTPRDAYARLIDAIIGNGTWNSNPCVFVYDFELIK